MSQQALCKIATTQASGLSTEGLQIKPGILGKSFTDRHKNVIEKLFGGDYLAGCMLDAVEILAE